MQKLNGKATKSITHTIQPILIIKTYTQSFTLLLRTKLGYHLMIFS